MTKFILHGGFTREDNELNRGFYDEFMKDVPAGGTVLLVYFAARSDEDMPERIEEHKQMCSKTVMDKNINFLVATREHFLDEVRVADAIFFNGGSTSKLMREIEPFRDFTSLIEGKTVAGSSAGTYMMATYGASHSEEVVREGLGLVPVRVICHYESIKLPPSELSVALLQKTAVDLEIVYLKDFEWKVF